VAGSVAPSTALVLTQRQAYVMGTRVDLSTLAPDRAEGLKRLETALDSLEATDAELSTWKPDSDVSAINKSPLGQLRPLRPRLCHLLGELQDWQTATLGVFDPGIGALTDAWDIHGNGRTPTPRELDIARTRSGIRLFDVDRVRCSVVRRETATIDVGAFGKGEALDRAGAMLNDLPWMIDFGGQVSVGGAPAGGMAWSVRIAHPVDRSRSIMSVQLKSGSLSTSAGAEHDLHINGVRIGHILDPRTGVPAPYTGSVVIWHERALVADILSTALYVMGPREGIEWAESRGIAAAFIIPGQGGIRTMATATFAALEPTTEPE
jgi:FAD:protein FMN transferase